jgi:multidrug resistance efflux pump
MISLKDSARALMPFIALGLAAAGYFYMQATKPVTVPRPAEERIWPVATVAAVPEDVQPEIKVFGQISAGRQVELRPLVEGRVIETGVAFVEGGVVAAGDLLIAIDPFDYENTRQERQAQVDEAKAKAAEIEAESIGARRLLARDKEQVSLRQRDVARRQGLVKRGATSQKALDDSRLALSEARQRQIERQRNIAQYAARIDQQKAVIARLDVQLRQAARDLVQTRLTAPFKGFVTNVSTELGKRVSRTDKVARVIDAGRLEVRVTL